MSEKPKSNIAFFFGAGAESCFEMPLGTQYTLDTILSKRSKMLSALKEFYKNRIGDYSSAYSKQFLFSKTSHTFREITERAARAIENIDEHKMDDESRDIVRSYKSYKNAQKLPKGNSARKKSEDDFSNIVSQLYDYVIIDIDLPNDPQKRSQIISKSKSDSDRERYYQIMNHFSYYGSVEKDFSTIINPTEAGNNRFWRLINYFWSAFFSIMIPVLNISLKSDKENFDQKYMSILDHLKEVIDYIYSEPYYKSIESVYQKSYYAILGDRFHNSYAVTANYTPFLSFSKFKDSPIYLAGKLSDFEIPEELKIIDIRNGYDISNKIIFPYLCTQAPIKPIIDCTQLSEYSKFIKLLNEIDTLVLIGYNINENDNHINSLLRHFLEINSNNRIAFFEYEKNPKDFSQVETENTIYNKLKIVSECMKGQIRVFPNSGDPACIMNHIKKLEND